MTAILGIDIAKNTFKTALLRDDKYKSKSFDNKDSGFEALDAWLNRHKVVTLHACLEATGSYGDALARHLFDAGHAVSVINPARIKAFGESELRRTKNDKMDAKLIARFCAKMNPPHWQPDPPEVEHLRMLGRRRDALVTMRTQEENRLGVVDFDVNASIQKVISFLEVEIEQISRLIKEHINNHPDLKKKRDLLKTIPGVGDVTIEAILSEINAFEGFESVEKVVAYMGLSPKEKTSGTSVKGKSTLCKIGSARLRKILYMPSLTAIQYNPLVRELYSRLKEKSKNGMIIACACMRKLVHIIFGVIKNKKPFDPNYNMKTA